MTKRIITAIAIIAVCAPCIYFGGIAFQLLAIAFAAVGCYEVLRLFDKKWPITLKAILYVLFISTPVLLKLIDNWYLISIILVMIILAGYLVFDEDITIEEIGLVFYFYNIIILTIYAFYTMYDISRWMIFFMLVATYMTDTFALFGGMLFGKHKLNERISPKKTIEGSACGWIIGGISSMIFGFLMLPDISKTFIIIGAFTLTIIGQIGDLLFSAIKRHYGIKDFGNIFPGHGGVLDRIDSLTLNSLWLLMLITIML